MLFSIGKISVSRGVLDCAEIATADLVAAFARYLKGDWGDLDNAWHISNDLALTMGQPVQAKYRSRAGTAFTIATEGGVTCIELTLESVQHLSCGA